VTPRAGGSPRSLPQCRGYLGRSVTNAARENNCPKSADVVCRILGVIRANVSPDLRRQRRFFPVRQHVRLG
jgi:hypothetical protein